MGRGHAEIKDASNLEMDIIIGDTASLLDTDGIYRRVDDGWDCSVPASDRGDGAHLELQLHESSDRVDVHLEGLAEKLLAYPLIGSVHLTDSLGIVCIWFDGTKSRSPTEASGIGSATDGHRPRV